MSVIKQISIKSGGKEFSAKWTVWALRQFMRGMLDLEAKKDELSETAYGMGYTQIAESVVENMMLRAGLSGEAFEELDADEIMTLSSQVLSWYMANMGQLTTSLGGEEPKNEVAPTAGTVSTP